MIASINIYLKNSSFNKKTTSIVGKKKNTRLMFLRAPKHFKTGKQFINYFKNTKQLIYKNYVLNTKNFIFLSSQQLYNLYTLFILKSNLPEFKINKVTYKFKLIVNIIGWCFIFKCYYQCCVFFVYILNTYIFS